jgi:16S rRNA (guanine(527)-N(7))-methyltransferase RsmG
MPTPLEDAQLIVTKLVTQFSIEPPPSLHRYLAEVLEWNVTLSLVSRKDPLAATERLLGESFELGQLLGVEAVEKVADVGSGAGFPGLVWALVYPYMGVTLIERRQRRAAFLERTALALAASNVVVVPQDLRDVPRETPFDLIATMAVGDPVEVAEHVEARLIDGGRFASTVPRDFRSAPQLGSRLRLERRVDGKFGCYVIYRSGV